MMNTPHPRPKIAVIGAGWAGLSAAVTLARHADVTCLKPAGRRAEGRAHWPEIPTVSVFWTTGSTFCSAHTGACCA